MSRRTKGVRLELPGFSGQQICAYDARLQIHLD
jgi:hypothetical protein